MRVRDELCGVDTCLVWGVISSKTFLSNLDTEITFGWSIMKAIASFEWSISLSKCKCCHLNGEPCSQTDTDTFDIPSGNEVRSVIDMADCSLIWHDGQSWKQ